MASRKASSTKAIKAPGKKESPEQGSEEAGQGCPVVGFGASAGGLEAFTEVLQHIPPDAGIALVLVQHLDPKHSSMLTELLARSTSIPVLSAREKVAVEPNRLYVIPPNANLRIGGGVLHLDPRPPAGHNMPIDLFFRSLAEDQGTKAIGVILSGTASDGTLGLKAIKTEGGITFAQSPDSAKYDGMPRSAIAAGCVDFILPPEGIARELMALCHHPYVHGAPAEAARPDQEDAFREVFAMLRSATGVDFSAYKPGTIRRRLLRRMALQKLNSVAQYVKYLKDNRGELQNLFQDVLINVTGFFREPATFEAIKSRVLPVLFHDRSPEEPVRVWVPGCSTGEEAYSIGICLLEFMREMGAEVPLQIFGTDLSETALERARSGVYPESISSDVSEDRLRRFFVRVNGSYQITRSVRDACIFARQNVTKDPPFSKLDLVLCRNVMIYLGPALQMAVLKLFHYALKAQGFLVLGNSETTGSSELFAPIDKQVKIYRKQPIAVPHRTDLGTYHEEHPLVPPAFAVEQPGGGEVQKRIDQMMLARYSPPAVLIDRNLRVLQFRGQTAPFLEPAPGAASLDLSRMLPAGLSLEVRKLMRKVEGQGAAAKSAPIPVTLREGLRTVRMSLSPVQSSDGEHQRQWLLVLEEVEPVRPKGQNKKAAGGRRPPRVKEVEQELATTREYLQTVIEEQEAATEELKSAHEEVQSANEELQSTNEELLTAKEELQSSNEELTTVNEEMQSRNAELQSINNDLLNLLSSVNVPIVMLGPDLRIRRFTPQAEKILNLLPSDAGRSIIDFRLKINVPDLAGLCREVLDDLVAKEREVQDAEGRTYTMWIRPYRTAENRIDGVVLLLFDLTERRQTAEARYRRLFEAAADGIVIADAGSGFVLDANPSVIKSTGYGRGQIVGTRFWEGPLFAGASIDESIISQLHETDSVQMTAALTAASGERLDVEVLCNLYEETAGKVVQFNIRDISARRRMEEQLRREETQLRQAQKMEAVGRLAGGVAHDFNNLLTAILGYCDLLEQQLDKNGEVGALVHQIRTAGERATMLTKQLLAFGRKQVVQPAMLSINDVIAEMQQLLGVMMPKDIELVFEPAKALGRVWADRSQTEQVVMNLVLNARDAMPNGGKVSVRTADVDVDQAFSEQHPAIPMGQYVAITVQDTGVGMDENTQAHMFEPFFTTKAKGEGVGLGLATTYGIVRNQGGYIWAYSELGIGTTFMVYLPRRQPEAASSELGVEKTGDSRGTETILLVEDEPALRALTQRFLEPRGYRILAAANGRQALQLAKQHKGPIHLLLTDVVMPHMSGRELAFQLERKRPETKVLYVSGHTEDTISHHGVLEDGVSFLQKPFTQGDLAAKVREVLDRKE